MGPFKRYLGLLLVTLVGIFVSLFLAEGFVRILFPHSRDHVIPAGLFAIDDHLGWKLRANVSRIHQTRYFDVVYTINALGFRDKPRNLPKDANVNRILLYGDSQIFGWGIPEPKRFSNIIENQVPNLEIWNLAVPGYGLDQEIISYQKVGKSLQANGVIFFVSEPTLERTLYHSIYRKNKPMFAIGERGELKLISIPKEKTFTANLAYKILSPFYLPYFLERRINTLKQILKNDNDHIEGADHADSMIPSDHVGDFEKKMVVMARDLAIENKQTITILAHLPASKRGDLQDFCRQNGIGFLEIVFDKKDDVIFGKYDKHWNLIAHKLMAEQIVSQLNKRQ